MVSLNISLRDTWSQLLGSSTVAGLDLQTFLLHNLHEAASGGTQRTAQRAVFCWNEKRCQLASRASEKGPSLGSLDCEAEAFVEQAAGAGA